MKCSQSLDEEQVQQLQFRRSKMPSLRYPLVLVSSVALAAGCSGNVDDSSWGPEEPGASTPSEPGEGSQQPVTPGVGPGPGTSGGPGVTPSNGGTNPATTGTPTDSPTGNPTTVTPTTTPPPVPIPGAPLSDCTTPGPRQIRRLSPVQYYRTLQSVFNDPNVPHEDVLSLPSVLGFHVDADAAVVRDLEGELLMNYAESVADWAVQNGKVGQFTSCTQQQAQCQTEFVQGFGEKAHREPLSQETVSAYTSLFAGESTFEDGAKVAMAAMLQSPFTLYRRELGVQQGTEYALTPYEVASQLSYLLTDAPPDSQLYEAAKNNQLASAEQLLAQADRLLSSAAGEETLSNFVGGWLEIDKLPSKAKNEQLLPLPDELRQSMIRETDELFLDIFHGGGTLADLYRANYSFVDQRLASHYGVGGGGGSEFSRIELANTDRPNGMLGHASFLTTHALSDNSSPVQRAKIVIERLICGQLPPVPMGLNVSLDTTTPFETNRDRYEMHRSVEPCKTCHENIDPIGYTFENYDGFGRYRTQENGHEIDASGSIAQLAVGKVELSGINSLSDALAESPEAQACLVRYWSYFTYGTDSWANVECNRDNVIRYAQAQDFSIKSVLQGIIQGPNFTRRVADNN